MSFHSFSSVGLLALTLSFVILVIALGLIATFLTDLSQPSSDVKPRLLALMLLLTCTLLLCML